MTTMKSECWKSNIFGINSTTQNGVTFCTTFIHEISSGGMCLKCIEFETPFLPTSHHIELHPFHNKDIHNSYNIVQRRHNLSSCIEKLCYKGAIICEVILESSGAFFLSKQRPLYICTWQNINSITVIVNYCTIFRISSTNCSILKTLGCWVSYLGRHRVLGYVHIRKGHKVH
jgi:hypothetical protein